MKNNDKAVRAQFERILTLRKRYHVAKSQASALNKQGSKEFKTLERLIAGKSHK
jgi:hypothetical protein